MALHIWNGTQWVIPTNVSRWDGTAWSSVTTVQRWDGTSWNIEWPVERPLQTSDATTAGSTGSTGWVDSQSEYRSGGYEPYKTVQIPSSHLNNGVSYVTRVDLRKGARHTTDDDEFGGIAHRVGVRLFYVYDAQPSVYSTAFVGNIMEHGPFDTTGDANGTLRGFTFTAPSDRVIIGFRFRSYGSGGGGDNLGTVLAGHTFYVRTGQIINPDDTITLTSSNQVSSTDTDSVNRDSGGNYFAYATATSPTASGSQYLSGVGLETSDETSGTVNDDNWGSRQYRARVTSYFNDGNITTQ